MFRSVRFWLFYRWNESNRIWHMCYRISMSETGLTEIKCLRYVYSQRFSYYKCCTWTSRACKWLPQLQWMGRTCFPIQLPSLNSAIGPSRLLYVTRMVYSLRARVSNLTTYYFGGGGLLWKYTQEDSIDLIDVDPYMQQADRLNHLAFNLRRSTVCVCSDCNSKNLGASFGVYVKWNFTDSWVLCILCNTGAFPI